MKKDAFVFISSGIIIILVSIMLQIRPGGPIILEISTQFLSHIGIGLLVIGILGILVDSNHWTKYFEERLSKIVTGKKYLEKLDIESLTDIQTEVLKAYFKNDDIGGSDGFLRYYQMNIQAFIGSPFRTNVNYNYQVDYLNEEKTKLVTKELSSWTCNANGGKIQSEIIYRPDLDTFEKVGHLQVTLQHSSFISSGFKDGKITFDREKLKEQNSLFADETGFSLSLEKYANLNKLHVEIVATYIISKDRFIAWGISYPTRGITITLQYPKDLRIISKFYFRNKNLTSESSTENLGQYYLVLHDWLMPNEGIAFQYLKR